MYEAPLLFKKLEGPEKDFVVLDTIKKECINKTVAGVPTFSIESIVNKIHKMGYYCSGRKVYFSITNAKVDDERVFERAGCNKPVYTCKEDLFNRLYDEKEIAYKLPLLMGIFR